MGNQHSAPDKDKDKEREKEKEREQEREREPHRAAFRHEKHRSRTLTPTPLPPTETKVNAEQTHSATSTITNSIPSTNSVEYTSSSSKLAPPPPPTGSSILASPEKERISKPITNKDVTEGIKNMHLKDLPRPNEEEIKKDVAETEPTPKFEAMRVPSQTSLVDEDELKEADKSGNIPF